MDSRNVDSGSRGAGPSGLHLHHHGGLPRTLHLPHLCSLPQGSQGCLCQVVEEELANNLYYKRGEQLVRGYMVVNPGWVG